jgi:DNA polymerase-4
MTYDSRKYIFHADGDNFFASCLAAQHPKYRNKPLVVGEERGMATAMSTEAKALGVTRGMPIFEIRQKYKDVIILKGDYPLFDQVSSRMHKLISDTSVCIEKYSIDESFADITDAIIKRNSTADIIGREIKSRLENQLGVIFSIGIAPTKTLAKLSGASQKPNGFTVAMDDASITPILSNSPIEKVWGIGRKTACKLRVRGIYTALDLRKASPSILSSFAKPVLDIQKELQGIIVHDIERTHGLEKSMISSQSFLSTTDSLFIKSELVRHIHILSGRLRNNNAACKIFTAYVKDKNEGIRSKTCTLLQYEQCPSVFMSELDRMLPDFYTTGDLIRTTGISISDIMPFSQTNGSLFSSNNDKESAIFSMIDKLKKKGLSINSGNFIHKKTPR